MSSIHNLVILSEVDDPVAIAQVNAWIRKLDTERGQQFEPVNTEYAGGTKSMTCAIYAVGANHVSYVDELRKALQSFGWISPGSVVMYDVHEYDDNRASVTRAGVPS